MNHGLSLPSAVDVFERRTALPVAAEQAFAWHERVGAFERLMPPWDRVVVTRNDGSVRPGAQVHMRVRVAPGVMLPWIAEHRDYEPGRLFRDVQLRGPFAHWDHRHVFRPAADAHTCVLHDCIEYRLPLGAIGRAFGTAMTTRKLGAMFAYRHRVTRGDLEMHARFANAPRRRVLVSGSTGVIGRQFCAMLTTGGHSVVRLVRSQHAHQAPDSVFWDPARGMIDHDALVRASVDSVVHLAGENVASGRWTSAFKQRFLDSRVKGTGLLIDALSRLASPPRVFVCASGSGYYGNRGEDAMNELAGPGRGFLADVTVAWEQVAARAADFGARTTMLRIGPALTPVGGMLASLLPPYSLGMGGTLGDGRQFIPWVSFDDCLAGTYEALMNPDLHGAINVVAPHAVRQSEFAETLAQVLRRPLLGGVLRRAIPAVLGQMGRECLLASTKASPEALTRVGFKFRQPNLETALRHVLGKLENPEFDPRAGSSSPNPS